MRKMKKKILVTLFISLSLHFQVQAEWSYGAKFLTTTVASCAAGYGAGYAYTSVNNYDSQPSQIISWMGAATGCLSGALFSYLFFDDSTDKLKTQNESDRKVIADLQIQITRLQNDKTLSGNKYAFNNEILGPNPFDNLDVKKIVEEKLIDLGNMPSGFTSDTCSKWYYFTLQGDNTISADKNDSKLEFIAIDKHYALIGFKFAYSYDGCFRPSTKQNGIFYERYWPSLNKFLNSRVRAFSLKVNQNNEE